MSDVLAEVEAVLVTRRTDAPEGSYSAGLVSDPALVTRKIMEEAYELCWEVGRDEVDTSRTASEAADLVFHLLAALVGAGVAWADVETELATRRGARQRPATPGEAP